METRVKVTSFSWHSGGCWCQIETGDSFSSEERATQGLEVLAGGRRPGRQCATHCPIPQAILPLRGGGRGQKRNDTILADSRSSVRKDPRCPLPVLLNVMPNWHVQPWGWGWGRHLSKEMGVMSELDPSASFI